MQREGRVGDIGSIAPQCGALVDKCGATSMWELLLVVEPLKQVDNCRKPAVGNAAEE